MKEILYILAGWNLITLLMMALDKYQAIRGGRRIRERTLLTTAFIMGGFGSLLGSLMFRHKTRKWKFRISLPLALIFNLSVIYLIWYYIVK